MRLSPNSTPATAAQEQQAHFHHHLEKVKLGLPIDIHYHTFTPGSLKEVLREAGIAGGTFSGFDIIAEAERYPVGRGDGIGLLLRKTGARRGRNVDGRKTFTFRTGGREIPLVCPTSLLPLAKEENAPGKPLLVTADGSCRYPIEDGIPTLMADTKSAKRPWTSPLWRRTWLTPLFRPVATLQ
jgi:uncharacterized protein YbaR (Trm112 family)